MPDLCLERIFEFVPDVRDRVTAVELVCKRWRRISCQTKVGGRKLFMQFADEASAMRVQFQDIYLDKSDAFSTYGQFKVHFPTLQSVAEARFYEGVAVDRKSVTSYLDEVSVQDVDSVFSGDLNGAGIGSRLERLCLHDTMMPSDYSQDEETRRIPIPPNLKSISVTGNATYNVGLFTESLVSSGKQLDSCYLDLGPKDFEDTDVVRDFRKLLQRCGRSELCMKFMKIQDPKSHTALTDFFGCQSIVSLDVHMNGTSLRHTGLNRLFSGISGLHNLETLKISGYKEIFTCTALRALVNEGLQPLEKLRHLELMNCFSGVRESGWTDCVQKIRNLKSFHMYFTVSFKDAHLYTLVNNNPDLEYLQLSSCRGLTFRSIFYVLKNCSHLKALKAIHVGPINPALYSILANQVASPHLEYVHVGLVRKAPPPQLMPVLTSRHEKIDHDGKNLKLSPHDYICEEFESRGYCEYCSQMM